MRLQDRQRHLVMLRYGAMHSEYYGPLFGRKISPAHGALHPLNTHFGPVNHLRHNDRMVSRKSAHVERYADTAESPYSGPVASFTKAVRENYETKPIKPKSG